MIAKRDGEINRLKNLLEIMEDIKKQRDNLVIELKQH